MPEDLKQLTPVELSEVWETEPHHFTPWLAQEENLMRLGETLRMDLELEAQEMNIGGFRADLLCKNTVDDSWVLIENQLASTDHTHVGQLLTYAAGLDASTVIWIAKTFRREHRAMLDWQNRVTDERYRFFGIEVKIWQIDDSARAVQFEVVSSPNDWSRGVSRDTQRAANQELSETEQRQLRYWTGLREHMVDNGGSVSSPSPRPARYLALSIGRGGFWLMIWQTPTRNEIGIWLCIDGENREAYFRLLAEEQDDIHTEMGEALQWIELSGRQRNRICLHKADTDPFDEDDWHRQYQWLTAKLELFDKVFRSRIKALDASDWVEADDAAMRE